MGMNKHHQKNGPHLLNFCEIYWAKGESVGFTLSKPIIHWSFECGEGSIPFSPSSLNGLQLR